MVTLLGWDSGVSLPRAAVSAGLSWAVVLTLARARGRAVLGLSMAEYERVARASLWSLLVMAAFVRVVDVTVALVLIGLAAALTLAGRVGVRGAMRHWVRTGRHNRRLLAVGPVEAAVRLAEALARAPDLGLTIVGVATDDLPAGEHVGPWPVVGPCAAAPILALEREADVMAVAIDRDHPGAIDGLLRTALDDTGVALLIQAEEARARGRTIALPSARFLHVDESPLRSGAWLVKAAFDRVAALLLLMLLAPVLAAVAVLVKATSPGPVFFRQPRAGRGGRPFRIVKFRTMRVDAEELLAELRRRTGQEGAFFKLEDDPRITPVGRTLRRLSVDELPQLWNVLRGDMSLVGPRPLPVSEAGWFSPVDRRRTLVRPGITGLWQVSGRSNLDASEAVRLDLTYVESWSLALDLVILLRTVGVVVRGDGAS